MSDDSVSFENLKTGISLKEAFKILNMQATFDKTLLQMNYHFQVFHLQDNNAKDRDFAKLRIAYEVLSKYIDTPEIQGSLEQTIDVSYLFEGIKYLSLLQEIRAREIDAIEREREFWDFYDGCEDIEEVGNPHESDDEPHEIIKPDFDYPDKGEADKLLKKIESLCFRDKKQGYESILAEAYYQMMIVGERPPKKSELVWYLWCYNYAKKALDTDNSQIKDVEYLYMCGYMLSMSGNKDNISQSINYLSEAEKRARGTFREGDVYYSLSFAYYSMDDYKNAFHYAKKLTEHAPERLDVYRILGNAAYSQLEVSSNQMYASEATKAFFLVLEGRIDFWNKPWVVEMLCKICTRSRNWALLEKLCGNPEDTYLNIFAYNYYMGVATMNTGREKDAVKYFMNILNLDDMNFERYKYTLYANISRCYEKIDYDKAREYMMEFQQFQFNDINYPKDCMMHFYLRKKKFEEARKSVSSFHGYMEIIELRKFRIDLCQAGSDDERRCVIDNIRDYMPNILEREKMSEKNGYHVKRGSVWTEKDACIIGDIYWFILRDDEMAIRYYELSIEIVDYWISLSEKYENPKRKASYAHYMLTRIYGELGNKKKMQKHANAFMDYVREYYSDDDSKPVEEQYINALDDFAIYGLLKYADYTYIKPSGEMGTEHCGDYNACRLVRYYIAVGNVYEARKIAVNLAKKYRKDIPALVYVLMGDLARVAGDKSTAEKMYRYALDKNPWEAFESIRYLGTPSAVFA